MSYLSIANFKEGLDSRRSSITTPSGSLLLANNCHITRGGEIEKRKAFVEEYELPAGTFGLHATATALYVFGSGTNPGVPAGVTYQQLIAPGAPDMVEVLASQSFNGVPYVVAKYEDGNVHHFYNGVRVTDWDTIAPSITDMDTLGAAMAEYINNSQYVNAVWDAVNNKVVVTGAFDDKSFTISGLTSNVGANPDNAIVVTSVQSASPTQPQIDDVALTGTYEAEDFWQVQITPIQTGVTETYFLTGTSSGTGVPLLTFRGKEYTATQSLLYFSDIDDPTNYDGTSGAGFINMSNQNGGSQILTALAPYQANIAVFSRRSTQIWFMDADPLNNRLLQVLDNIGTMAPRSAISFGDVDVFFLSDTGIRSLRARDSSNSASVFDVGTSIDSLVLAQMKATEEPQVIRAAGVMEPTEGRYLLAIGDKVFVYSFFPGSKISAWTTYTPGFTIEFWGVKQDRLYCRSGDTIYLYGGITGDVYDGYDVDIQMAWLDASKPATRKDWKSLDLACDGQWEIMVNYDPKLPNVFDGAGSVVDQNYSLPNFNIQGQGTHLGLKLKVPAGYNDYARLSAIAIHFDYTTTD